MTTDTLLPSNGQLALLSELTLSEVGVMAIQWKWGTFKTHRVGYFAGNRSSWPLQEDELAQSGSLSCSTWDNRDKPGIFLIHTHKKKKICLSALLYIYCSVWIPSMLPLSDSYKQFNTVSVTVFLQFSNLVSNNCSICSFFFFLNNHPWYVYLCVWFSSWGLFW